MVAPSVLPRR